MLGNAGLLLHLEEILSLSNAIITHHAMILRELKIALLLATTLILGRPNSYAQSEITWPGGTVFDFGMIKEADGDVCHRFTFRNTGKEPFVVLGATGKCGCTNASYSKEEIAPGDTASVVVKFNPKGRSGTFKQRVTVLLSSPSRHNTLFIKGVIEPNDSTININNLNLNQ